MNLRVQPQDYHQFADTRAWLGIENAADTLSNLGLLAVGIAGLAFLWRERGAVGSRRFGSPVELAPYFVFFAGIAATSAGSAWYHLAPGDARLAWDRLPMAVAFMSLLAAVIVERLSVRAGLRPEDLDQQLRATVGDQVVLGERGRAVDQAQHLSPPHPVANRCLHEAGGRRRGDEDGTLGEERDLEAGLELLHELVDARATVAHHRARLRLDDVGVDLGGPG